MVAEIRRNYKNEEISFTLSTRETLAMAELIANGFELDEAWNLIAGQKSENEDDIELLTSVLMIA